MSPSIYCSTTHLANGALEYIDSTQPGLKVDIEFNDMKDFVGTAYIGILGAGLAYLRMLHGGYVWKAHYAEVKWSGGGVAHAEPDFAFAKPGLPGKVALVESKGTGDNVAADIAAAKSGLLLQVHPVAGVLLPKLGIPSRGYAFDTALNLKTHQQSSLVQMAMVFSTFAGSSGAAPTIPGLPSPPNIQQAVLTVQQIQMANHKEVLTQLGLNIANREEATRLPLRDDQIYQLRWRHALEIGDERWTATIALPKGVIRAIAQGILPDGFEEVVRKRSAKE